MEMQMLDQDNLDLSKPIKDCKIARLQDSKKLLAISQEVTGNLAIS